MEILAAFIAGAIFAAFVTSSKRSAIDHALERPVIRGGCIFPNGEELPPMPRPTTSLVPIDDPTLSPDQVTAINQLDVCRRAREAEGGGWPT